MPDSGKYLYTDFTAVDFALFGMVVEDDLYDSAITIAEACHLLNCDHVMKAVRLKHPPLSATIEEILRARQ